MNQDEDISILIELLDALQGHLEVVQDLLVLIRKVINFKDVDEHFHSSENGLLLDQEVLLHESILTSTVP